MNYNIYDQIGFLTITVRNVQIEQMIGFACHD